MDDCRTADVAGDLERVKKEPLRGRSLVLRYREMGPADLTEGDGSALGDPVSGKVERLALDLFGGRETDLVRQREEVHGVRRDDEGDSYRSLLLDSMAQRLDALELGSVVLCRTERLMVPVMGRKEHVRAAFPLEPPRGLNALPTRREMAMVVDDRQVGRERHAARPDLAQ
jgi:hypothetical protein